MEFSKWNKRVTAWLLLIAGFYMGIMEYDIIYVITFLGSGLTAIGLSIYQSVQSVSHTKDPDLPPVDKEEK